ncbi:AMP-binding protein [Brevibacillus humidisoli]|uniref:AMP-binding protein n=1 Tax=Brevibacillus humidisoli TaxID=2895522 RepID=UPI001E3D5488|nr:AMP-binding protein [Brevibacillus humidisoli]UFJ39311.1 AMP-binding protein [Brevibacillus humidisoli]
MFILHAFVRLLCKLMFCVRLQGLEKIDFSQPALIIPNHVSLLDAVLLSAYLPKSATFVANTDIAKRFAFLLRYRKHITVDPLNPYSMRRMLRVVKEGESLVIFPEGRITTTGGLMKIYSGVGYIAMRTGVTVYPVTILGLERSVFSYLKDKVRQSWFPQVTVAVGSPFTLQRDPNRSMREQKAEASDFILRIMQQELFQARMKTGVNLFNEALQAARMHGANLEICKDLTTAVTYRKLLIASYVLGRKLNPLLPANQNVGVLLPTSIGHATLLFSLFRIGKTPAILNFSLGVRTLLDCCETAGIYTILTSRVFVEKGKLESLIAGLQEKVSIIYLEDIRESVTLGDKLTGLGLYLIGKQSKAKNNELILFTSGSESKPKGVVLTHQNLYANIQQVRSVIDFTSRDKIFNALPMFHSFGLTAGTFLPILTGVPVYLYPSPLHYKVIAELCYDQNVTIMFGTSTFLAGYGKHAHSYNFYSLRYVFAGAEKLKEDVRQLWQEKFGVRIFEGYGATETSPILSLNTPLCNRQGTVGRLLPGIEHRLEPVEGIAAGGHLVVRGPNVMKGYLMHGKGFIPVEEWYQTGDLVETDHDGYVTIQSRLKRFAKIGGEMISLNLVEELAVQCYGHSEFAAVAISDRRKGERIILYTTDPAAQLVALRRYITENGYSPLLQPQSIRVVPQLPLLGSGKTDYVSLKQMAERGDQAHAPTTA